MKYTEIIITQLTSVGWVKFIFNKSQKAGAETLAFKIFRGVKNDRSRRKWEGEKGNSCDFK